VVVAIRKPNAKYCNIVHVFDFFRDIALEEKIFAHIPKSIATWICAEGRILARKTSNRLEFTRIGTYLRWFKDGWGRNADVQGAERG
jgi:hypothetical protein